MLSMIFLGIYKNLYKIIIFFANNIYYANPLLNIGPTRKKFQINV